MEYKTEYFIVKVKMKPHIYLDRLNDGVRNPSNWLWLADNEHGYWSHSVSEDHAERFSEPPTLRQIRAYSDWPYYCQHDETVQPIIIKVTETVIQTREIVE